MKRLKGYKADRAATESDVKAQWNDVMQKYGGMNSGELFDELKKQIALQRAEGTYSPERMSAYVEAISPYLTAEQRAMVEEIVGKV